MPLPRCGARGRAVMPRDLLTGVTISLRSRVRAGSARRRHAWGGNNGRSAPTTNAAHDLLRPWYGLPRTQGRTWGQSAWAMLSDSRDGPPDARRPAPSRPRHNAVERVHRPDQDARLVWGRQVGGEG